MQGCDGHEGTFKDASSNSKEKGRPTIRQEHTRGIMATDNFIHEDFCHGLGFDIWYGECFCPFRAHIHEDQYITILVVRHGPWTADIDTNLLKWCFDRDWKEWCCLALFGGLLHGTMFTAQAPMLDIHVHLRPEIEISKLGKGFVYSEVTAGR